MGLYQRIAGLLPRGIITAFAREMRYVGIQVGDKQFVGFLVLFGFGISIAISVNLFLFFKINPVMTFVISMVAVLGGVYFWLSQTAEGEGKRAERLFPDVLELISSNIKAGLTTERALFASARPEFGVISDELKVASREIMSGERLENSLTAISTRIKSSVLERSIWLLTQGIRSGGEIAGLLIQLSADLREENAMKDEISANISMYVILIFSAAIIGAPLLFGISSVIVGILVEQTGSISISPEQMSDYSSMSSIGRFMGLPTVNITESFIVGFSVIMLVIISVFASFTTGAMAAGSEREGVKYIPILVIGSLGLFFAIRIVLGGMLGSLTTMM